MVNGALSASQVNAFAWDALYLALFAIAMAVLGYLAARRALAPS